MIHPGVKKSMHEDAMRIIHKHISYIYTNLESEALQDEIRQTYDSINPEKYAKASFEVIWDALVKMIDKGLIKILVMNADTNVTDKQYNNGFNIIIGGNVLGRGVTFPKLHTLYYTRTAKKPQADTMWQHSRIFGYDRDGGMMAVFITKHLYKLFSDINAGNNSIISQVNRNLEKIQLFYPEGINPTRKNVIDLRMVNLVTGGTNYYPSDPENTDSSSLDRILSRFDSEGYYQVSAKLLLELLSFIKPSEDFNMNAFVDILKARIADNPSEQSIRRSMKAQLNF